MKMTAKNIAAALAVVALGLVISVGIRHRPDPEEATPGGTELTVGLGSPALADSLAGGTKYDTNSKSYAGVPCKATKNARLQVTTTAVPCVASPLSNRTILTMCASPETLILTDGGLGARIKIRTDGTAPAWGFTTAGTILTAGGPLATGTAQQCVTLNMGGNDAGWPQCIAEYVLTDGGSAGLLDTYECAYQ